MYLWNVKKSPIISGSFAKNDLQLKGSDESSPPCIKLAFKISKNMYLCVKKKPIKESFKKDV